MYLPAFTKLIRRINKAPWSGRLLAIDPGETTGYACFDTLQDSEVQITDAAQITTWPINNAVENFNNLISLCSPQLIVYEVYRIYSWRTQDHSWNQVPTLQIIGALETLAHLHHIPVVKQIPQQAKQFCTDDKLKQWELTDYLRGRKHARDAARHAAYFLLFGKSDNTSNELIHDVPNKD